MAMSDSDLRRGQCWLLAGLEANLLGEVNMTGGGPPVARCHCGPVDQKLKDKERSRSRGRKLEPLKSGEQTNMRFSKGSAVTFSRSTRSLSRLPRKLLLGVGIRSHERASSNRQQQQPYDLYFCWTNFTLSIYRSKCTFQRWLTQCGY